MMGCFSQCNFPYLESNLWCLNLCLCAIVPVRGERSFVLVASLKRGEVCPSDAFCDLLSHGKSMLRSWVAEKQVFPYRDIHQVCGCCLLGYKAIRVLIGLASYLISIRDRTKRTGHPCSGHHWVLYCCKGLVEGNLIYSSTLDSFMINCQMRLLLIIFIHVTFFQVPKKSPKVWKISNIHGRRSSIMKYPLSIAHSDQLISSSSETFQ